MEKSALPRHASIDIAFNITDKAFDKDRDAILERCRTDAVFPILVGLDGQTSRQCIAYAENYGLLCYAGIHPTSSDSDVSMLRDLLQSRRVVALGECGLDFDRLNFRGASEQKTVFEQQLELRARTYFLHSRSCHREFMEMISDYTFRGVVHSFTGDAEEARDYTRRGLFIGINGCSLKTEEQLDAVCSIPSDSILVETDAPYCKIRKSSAGYRYITTGESERKLARRNEPGSIVQVVEALAGVHGISKDELAWQVRNNAVSLFGEKLEAAAGRFFQGA